MDDGPIRVAVMGTNVTLEPSDFNGTDLKLKSDCHNEVKKEPNGLDGSKVKLQSDDDDTVMKEPNGSDVKLESDAKLELGLDDIEGDGDVSDEGMLFVPERLLEEELKVRAKNEEDARKEEEEAKARPDALTSAERYDKLMALLGRSAIYSKYLLDKIENDNDATALKRKKLEERKRLKEAAKKGRGKKRNAAKSHPDEPRSKKLKPELSRTFEGEDIPDEQPLLLSGGIMRDYQIKGYQWVSTLFENDINGILADEMGLGKTIQTIALFCHLVEMGVPGPFLVVAPLSTVPNWIKEFRRFAPLFPTVLYHGNKKEREDIRRAKLRESAFIEGLEKHVMNVFVTSYEIVINDRPTLAKVKWRFIVVDEGHRLKNMNCKLIRELKQYNSVNKLLLTGTPLQNNLSELWSLLNFIMPEIFDDLRVFESWFDAKEMDQNKSEPERILRQEKQNNILSTLHQILTPFLLRRVKADVDLKIPPKKEVLVYCPMTSRQRDFYEATVNRTIKELLGVETKEEPIEVNLTTGRSMRRGAVMDYSVLFGKENEDEEDESDRSMDDYMEKLAEWQKARDMRNCTSAYQAEKTRATTDVRVCMKNRMMDLRKATSHPYLIEHPLSEDGVFFQADQDMIDICGKMKVLDQMLKALIGRQHKVLIFSQMTRMLDILGDYLNLQEFKFSRLDGNMAFEDRQENIDRFNDDPDVKIFLLSTRAGGLGINLTAADTCIIYDSDWNPQQDLQAQDRCHRIGQTKPVMVYRLVTANTIDQRIVERAAAKRKLEKLIIHSKKFKSQDSVGLKKTMEAISPQELLDLLNSKDHAGVVDRADGTVFSEEELDTLLDRSEMNWTKMASAAKERVGEMFKVIDDEEAGRGVLLSVKED